MEQSGTVDKALKVLHCLQRQPGATSLAQVAGLCGMPKPTVHRLLASLQSHELVEQHEDGRYALGVGLVRLGLSALSVDPLARVARAELEREVREFGETFFVVGARAGRLLVIDKVEGTGLLRAAPSIGAEVPVETTASGRLFLAFAPDRLADASERIARCTEAIARARTQAYDVNQGEWIAGLTVVAAPVRGHGGMLGTVACAAAASQLSEQRLAEAVRRTVHAANRVTVALGGRVEERP